MSGRSEVSATTAFRIAKLMGVSLYDVLAGTAFPPGVCKHCGRSSEESPASAAVTSNVTAALTIKHAARFRQP